MNNETNNQSRINNIREQMLTNLNHYKNNPGLIINTLYDGLFTISDGAYDAKIVNSPFDYIMECVAMTTSTLHNSHEATYRKQYPRLATQYSDLYNHMFDEHYIGRFATPGKVTLNISFKLQEILDQLESTEEKGVKKLIFPRGSVIIAKDYTFTLLYPIVITQLVHGGIQVLYDTSTKDPVQPLNSNIIDWDYTVMDNEEYLRIKPVLQQISLNVKVDTLTQNTGYHVKYPLKNKYVHCRIFQVDEFGRETEIRTTHSDLVYDANVVTARLTYLEDELSIHIPPIYFNKGMTGMTIRTEIYQTLGNIEEPLNEASVDSFSFQWDKINNVYQDSKYVSPIESLSSPIILARSMLQGGTDGESFEETRDRVINFTNYSETAITPNQLKNSLRIKGYDIIKSRDTLTSRSYYATKSLPLNKYDTFTSGPAASMETVRVSLKDLAQHPHIRDNGKRLTITPNTLFKSNKGLIQLVYPESMPDIIRDGIDAYIGDINKLDYMYTPFYYVCDTTKNEFDFRAYYLDTPHVENQIFVANNSSSQMSVSSDEVVIVRYTDKDGEGYKIRVRTRSTENYKKIPVEDLFCQLAISPVGEDGVYASINGVPVGKVNDEENEVQDIVFEFTIKTDWDITSRHGLMCKEFYMFINEPRTFEFPLDCQLNFVYGVKNQVVKDYQANIVDKMVNKEIIDSDDIIAITHDTIECQFGQYLKNFWANGIAVQGETIYKRYKHDVPRVYTQDVYDVDENGIFVVDENELRLIHRAGDPVLDEEGHPVLLHRAGDVVIGSNGLPVKVDGGDREIIRMLDIMMIDGIYYFATDENDMRYRNNVGDILRRYIVNDLANIGDRLLENTKIYFYPKRTMGEAKILVDDGTEIQVPMRLSFKVTYFLDEATYNDFNIRQAIIRVTHEVINKHLENERVSRTDMLTDLKSQAGEGVLAVDIEKFGPEKNLTVFTTKDASVRCSVKRLLRVQADRTLKVVEDIDINFVKHDTITGGRY